MDIDQISFGIKASAGKASTSLDRLVQSLDKLNDAFARVQTSGTGAITTLNGIVSASSGIKTGLKGASASAKTTSTAMKQVTTTTRNTSNALNTMRARLKTVGSAMVGVRRDTKNATSGMSRLIQKITQITFVVYVARRALRAFGQGIQASIDYIENLNLFMVALGENTSRATGFIKEMSESLYLDEARLTRVQGLFYQISESLGLGSDKAYTLSENFTKLAYDLASFYNMPDVEDAVTKLQAGLVGETEPLRRIGIIITENNLAETARNLGIRKSIRNMTEMEKIQLRYVTALQQTQNAQGDLARTLDQPENLLRILKEQFQVLMRELGNMAIRIIEDVIPQVIGLTMALADLARQMAKTLGYEAPEIRDDLGGFAKTVAKESKDMEKSTDKTQKNWAKILKYTRDSASAMTGIDELNVLSDDEGGFTGMSVDDLFPTADETRDQIDLGIEEYNNNMEASKGLFADIIQQWKDLFTEIGNVFETTKTAVKGLWEEVFGTEGPDGDRMEGLRIMNEIITGIVTGVTDMIKFFKELYQDSLKPIFELIAPDWIANLSEGTDGELAKTVAFLTKAFVAWKAIKISTSILGLFGNMITVGGLIGGKTGLLALIGAVAGLKIGIDIHKAIVDGDWKALEDEILNSMVFGLAGLATKLVTGSTGLGILVFSIPVMLQLDVKGLYGKSLDFFKNLFGPTTEDALAGQLAELGFDPQDTEITTAFDPQPAPTSAPPLPASVPSLPSSAPTSSIDPRVELMQKIVADKSEPLWWRSDSSEKGFARILEYIKDTDNAMKILDNIGAHALTPQKIWDAYFRVTNDKPIKSFASGGVPEKGNLFVAGEKGPELVTEHNGETVVMNEQQLKDRGISFYADGTNVPKAGPFHELSDSTMSADWGSLTNGFEKAVNGLVKRFGSISAIIDTTYVAFKTLTVVGIGTLINSFNKFANSKSFQTLFKSAPAEGGTTEQQQEAMGGMIGATLGEGPAGQIFALAQHIADGTVGKFLESAPLMIDAGMDFLTNLLDGIGEAMPAIVQALPNVITKIIEAVVEILTNKDSLNMIIESLLLIIASIVQALPDIIFALVDAIPDIVMTLIKVFVENIPLFLKVGLAIGVAILEGLANILIGGINAIIDGINWLIPGKRWDIKKIGKADFSAMMPTFAEGGFPQQGQMFIAREAGAELVGNIGGSTAVANNDQIVTAVSDGVYRAVSQAMSEQGGQRVSLRVDGRRMSEAMDLASKKRGLAFGTGGY